MRYLNWFFSIGVLAAFTGCASTPRVAVLPPLGPAPGQPAKAAGEGFLEVFSARQPRVVNPDAEEFFWNNDFGRNDFLHVPAHTDYTIYSEDGKLLKRVHNARSTYDAQPAVIALAPGKYRVEAQAEDYDAVTFTAIVPVVIEAGATTVAYLDEQAQPATHHLQASVVHLPNGRIAGWQANVADSKGGLAGVKQ